MVNEAASASVMTIMNGVLSACLCASRYDFETIKIA